jgi:hypothetical protein
LFAFEVIGKATTASSKHTAGFNELPTRPSHAASDRSGNLLFVQVESKAQADSSQALGMTAERSEHMQGNFCSTTLAHGAAMRPAATNSRQKYIRRTAVLRQPAGI